MSVHFPVIYGEDNETFMCEASVAPLSWPEGHREYAVDLYSVEAPDGSQVKEPLAPDFKDAVEEEAVKAFEGSL